MHSFVVSWATVTRTVFHTIFLGTIKNYLCTKYHIPGSNSSSDVDSKSRANS
jgi:hypothetical protein